MTNPTTPTGTNPVRLQINQKMASLELMKATAFPFTFPVKVCSKQDIETLCKELPRISDLIIDKRLVEIVTFDDSTSEIDAEGYNIPVTVNLRAEDAVMSVRQMEQMIRTLHTRVLGLEDDLISVRSQQLG